MHTCIGQHVCYSLSRRLVIAQYGYPTFYLLPHNVPLFIITAVAWVTKEQ